MHDHTTEQSPYEVIAIPLSGKAGQGDVALVDAADRDLVAAYKWNLLRSFQCLYAVTYVGRKRVLMHRLVMDAKKGQIVDHINFNGLDNRRANLRLCTPAENAMHSRKRRNSVSRYIGVTWHTASKSWAVSIKHSGKSFRQPGFATEVEAAVFRDSLARKLHGEFASLNFPEIAHDAPLPLSYESAGRPAIGSTLMLQAELQKRDPSADVSDLYSRWLECYKADKGKVPADPKRSFRAAVANARRRLLASS